MGPVSIRGVAAVSAVVMLATGGWGSSQAADVQGRPALTFTEVTDAAGIRHVHGHVEGTKIDQIARVGGGVAAGDYDGDGWVDLYVVAGDAGTNALYRNRGDGTFEEVAHAAGVALSQRRSSGPVFADYDGDGHLDLFVGAVDSAGPTLFRNRGNGSFQAQDTTRLFPTGPYTSSTFGDYDLDGDLDLFVTHWGLFSRVRRIDHLWRNNGDGTFSPATTEAGLEIKTAAGPLGLQWSFTANFADIDNDGWPDLLLASDFGLSQVFLNNRGGTFTETTSEVISDENGMGAAVGDYDNDGDLDWFVTSIFDGTGVPREEWGATGNRLYRNRGDGSFEDVTDASGVRDGSWGWAACFADFDNDGWLDLFHVNGWDGDPMFVDQPARLFMSNGDGSFSDRAAEAGVADRGDGRAVVCFDYDRDGDIDVFIGNHEGASRLYRNEGGENGFLTVRLRGRSPNTEAIGARVHVMAGGRVQLRELRAGSNYVSQDPAEAHFGLGRSSIVDEVRVVWPGGEQTVSSAVALQQTLVIDQDPGDANCDRRLSAADVTRSIVLQGQRVPPGCPFADIDGDGNVEPAETLATLALVFCDAAGGTTE